MKNYTEQQRLISSYSNQLTGRLYSNSMALEVLICLILILMLVVEIIKLGKKAYEWQTEYEVTMDIRDYEESKVAVTKEPAQGYPMDNQNEGQPKSAALRQDQQNSMVIRGRIKKQVYIPPIVAIEEIIKIKLPQLAIIAVNIALLSSYEFMSISGYITVVLITISEILGLKQAEHINLKFVLDILSKLLMLGWYINVMAVSKPSPS